MAISLGNLALGTSSWLFDAWRGVFYPDALAARDFLSFYARQFRTVEVNTSFYATPRASTMETWATTVPDGFTFCLKFPRAITHEKRLVDCAAETELFLARLRLLGDRAGPAFLQFPPGFSRAQDGAQLARFLDWLVPRLGALRVGVEVRHVDLHTAAFATFLAERGLALVLVDRVNTPDMYDIWVELAAAGNAPDFTIIRWIGDDVDGPKGDRDLTAPRDADLARWTDRAVALLSAGIDLFGYMHNPYEGHAPASIRRFEARLRGRMEFPAWSPPPAAPAGQLGLFD